MSWHVLNILWRFGRSSARPPGAFDLRMLGAAGLLCAELCSRGASKPSHPSPNEKTKRPTPRSKELSANPRDLALRFCQLQRLPPRCAEDLAQRLLRLVEAAAQKAAEQKAPQAPKARARAQAARARVDLEDVEAVRRRVRALQKKIREIEKLKAGGEKRGCLVG